jgi:hypothetical protein
MSGIKEGDPLGPLLFAFTLHGPLTRTAASHPATQIIAYFDDINIVGPAAAADPAFEALAAAVRTVGLTPVPGKSTAYSLEQDMAAAAAADLGILHARDGLVVAGTQLSTDQFVHDFLARKRQEVQDELQRLTELPHPLTCQDKWVILPHFMQLRLQHLSRTVPPATSRPHLYLFLIDSSVSRLVAFPRPTLFALSHDLLFVVDSRFLPCRCNKPYIQQQPSGVVILHTLSKQ